MTLEQAAREALDYLNEATAAEFARGTDHNVRWALEETLGFPDDERGTPDRWDAETLEDATSGIVFPPKLEVVQ